jgi:glycosyltransferase involved in cell wall biosynthesis
MDVNKIEKLSSNFLRYHKNEILIKCGINVITHYDSFGVGQHGYYFEKILQKLRIPFNLIKVGRNDGYEANMKKIVNQFNYKFLFVLTTINADNSMYIDNLKLSDKYIKIGHWAWELSKFPYTYLDSNLDEIWSISDFSASSINRVSSNKVVNIQPPCLPISKNIGWYGKALIDKFKLNDKIVFSTFYDENSGLGRKNPFVLLDIFLEKKFTYKILIVKVSGNLKADRIEKYKKADNIIFISDILKYNDLVDIYKISDVYVSTAKSEGQGRSIMESLQCGTKVFAVNYSAIREFYLNKNITFIKHNLEFVNCEVYNKFLNNTSAKWASMDKDSLLNHIMHINQKIPKNKNLISEIEDNYSIKKSAKIVGERLHSLKKKYIEKLLVNKLKLIPDYKKSNIIYTDIPDDDFVAVKDRFYNPGSLSKYSYKNEDVVDLMNQYCIDFKNKNKEYFSVDQEEEIDFTIYTQKKCILTTSNINYISRVNVLAKSIFKQHGPIDVYNIIVDDYSEDTKKLIKNQKFPFIPIFLDELDINSVRDLKWMSFQYDTQDLNTAAKPFGFKYLFDKGYQQVLYFDCDIEVFHSLDNLFSKLDKNSFVVTPHFTRPLPDYDGANPVDNIVNRCGQFNLGFIGISNKKNGIHFVNYWCSKTKNKFNVDLENGIFTDQVWCNLLPSFYDDCFIERSFAYNIAYWNLSHRDKTILIKNGKPYTSSDPVVFIHYSGIDIKDDTQLSKHQNVLNLNDMNFEPLQKNYINLINKEIEKYTDVLNIKNKFDCYSDNTEIPKNHRDWIIQMTDEEFSKICMDFNNPFSISFKNYFKNLKIQGWSFDDFMLLKGRPDVVNHCIDKDKFDDWKSKNK